MKMNYEKINKMSRANIQLYFDIVDYPKAYPVGWVKSDGYPFMIECQKNGEYVEPILELYEQIMLYPWRFNYEVIKQCPIQKNMENYGK
jgi:hypothetical protein